MAFPSEYHTDDGRVFIPTTFTAEYNKHESVDAAANAMAIESKRLLVIGSRLRRRGFDVRRHGNRRSISKYA